MFSCRTKKSGAMTVLSLIALLLGLSGCAASNPTQFLAITRASAAGIPNLKGIKKLDHAEGAYSIETSQQSVFASGLKECKVPSRSTPASLNRQLYVGFDNLKITNQDRFKTGQFTSEATALIGSDPIFMMAISSKSKDCIYDVVFWKENPEEFLPETIEVCKKIAARILALEEVK